MKKLTEIQVAAYRGLRDLEVKGLEDINVLIGPSNTGKSSLLEAVWLASNHEELPTSLETILRSRGLAGAISLTALFPIVDPRTPVKIGLRVVDLLMREEGNLTIQLPPGGRVTSYIELLSQQGWKQGEFAILEVTGLHTEHSIQKSGGMDTEMHELREQIAVRLTDSTVDGGFVLSGRNFALLESRSFLLPRELTLPSTFDDAYSNAYLSGTLPGLIEVLKVLHPALEDIRPVKAEEGKWIMYVRLPHAAVPLMALGDGFKAAFVILAYATSGGLLLLDTPEAFQHRKGLELLAKSLVEAAAQYQAQIILATQSLEFLDLLLQEGAEKHVRLKIYRFGLSEGQVIVHHPFTLEKAREARELIGADLRG